MIVNEYFILLDALMTRKFLSVYYFSLFMTNF